MKNLPILTAWSCVLLLGGLSAAFAWQDAADQPTKTPESAATNDAENTSDPAAKNDDKNALTGKEAAERAQQVLNEARELLFTSPAIRAKVTQTAQFGEFRVRSEGNYRCKPGFRYRLQYTVQLDELEGQFLEISDGNVLHTVRTLVPRNAGLEEAQDDVEVTRRDIQRIKREISKHLGNQEAEKAAEVGLGGLPSILASLDRTMGFDQVVEGKIGDRPVTTIQGAWRADRRNEILSQLGPIGNQLDPLIPDLVRVAIDMETKFPVRIQYLKKTEAESATYTPMLTLAFSDVRFGAAAEVDDFDFSYIHPPNLQVIDRTPEYIELIKQSTGGVSEQPLPFQ
ncbi:MAG: hypothetical protein KDA69_17155 [Planctomycetaceae bacterium]|nr:hypothetical protein [Planctomycetaceae bacterium]